MKRLIKRLKSRTHWLGIGTQLLGALALVQGNVHQLGIPPDKIGFVIIGIGVAINVLREMTTKPVDAK